MKIIRFFVKVRRKIFGNEDYYWPDREYIGRCDGCNQNKNLVYRKRAMYAEFGQLAEHSQYLCEDCYQGIDYLFLWGVLFWVGLGMFVAFIEIASGQPEIPGLFGLRGSVVMLMMDT